MNNLLKNLRKAFIATAIVILVLITIISTIGFFIEFTHYGTLNENYIALKGNLGTDSITNSSKLNQAEQNNKTLTEKNNQLTTQNSSFSEMYGSLGQISGKISGQIIISSSNISQYQLICAINVDNTNLKYCLTVSSVQQKFLLSLPEGSYNLVAQGLDGAGNPIVGFKGYYTEYVQCNILGSGKCDSALSKKNISLVVKSNIVLKNVDPIDWMNI